MVASASVERFLCVRLYRTIIDRSGILAISISIIKPYVLLIPITTVATHSTITTTTTTTTTTTITTTTATTTTTTTTTTDYSLHVSTCHP